MSSEQISLNLLSTDPDGDVRQGSLEKIIATLLRTGMATPLIEQLKELRKMAEDTFRSHGLDPSQYEQVRLDPFGDTKEVPEGWGQDLIQAARIIRLDEYIKGLG